MICLSVMDALSCIVKKIQTGLLIISIVSFCPLYTSADEKSCDKKYMINQQVRLEQCILTNYKTNIRPALKANNFTEVSLEFAAMDIRFNSKYKIFYLMGIIKADWTDDLLVWDPADYGGIGLTQTYSNNIWTPPMYYEGLLGSPLQSLFTDTMTDIRSSGNISYLNFVTFNTMCTSHLMYFPRDEHECYVYIESFDKLKFRLPTLNGLQSKDEVISDFLDIMMTGYNKDAQVFQMLNVTLSLEAYEIREEAEITTSESIVITVKLRRNTSLLSVLYLKAFTIGLLVLVPMMTPVTGIVRMSLPLITFFGSLYGIDRIDNVVNIYTAEDVPFIVIYYRNIILLSLFILGESFVYLLLSEQTLELPELLEKLYNHVTQHNVYNYLEVIRNVYFIRPNFENESLVGSPNLADKHTYKDLMDIVDTFSSYLVLLLMGVFYIQLVA